MKRLLVLSILLVIISSGLLGCGQISNTVMERFNNKNDADFEKEGLEPDQILKKAYEKIQDWEGIHYITLGERNLKLSTRNGKLHENEITSMTTKAKLDPLTLHMEGATKYADSEEEPFEAYLYEDKFYVKEPGNYGWLSMEGTEVEEQFLMQNPIQAAEDANRILELASNEDNRSKVKMKEEENQYKILLEIDDKFSSETISTLLAYTFVELQNLGRSQDMEEMSIEKLEIIFTIDKSNYQMTDMRTVFKTKYKKGKESMELDANYYTEIRREINNNIEIPKNIPEVAEDITEEMLEQSDN